MIGILHREGSRPVVLVSGLGRLGKRYLQALNAVEVPLSIWGFDPSQESLATAASTLSENVKTGVHHEFRLVDDVLAIPRRIDLAISATTADRRLASLRQLLGHSEVKYMILEKVLAQSVGELDELKFLCDRSVQAWVNLPRRLFPDFLDIRARFDGHGPIQAVVDGRNWGLATSGLHFIDLIAWLSGEEVSSIDVEAGPLVWRESKRSGFLECSGTLVTTFGLGSSLVMRDSSHDSGEPWDYEVQLRTLAKRGVLTLTEHEVGDPPGEVRHGVDPVRMLRLSEFAGPLVSRILSSGTCGLPSLDSVVGAHERFLRALMSGNPGSDSLLQSVRIT